MRCNCWAWEMHGSRYGCLALVTMSCDIMCEVHTATCSLLGYKSETNMNYCKGEDEAGGRDKHRGRGAGLVFELGPILLHYTPEARSKILGRLKLVTRTWWRKQVISRMAQEAVHSFGGWRSSQGCNTVFWISVDTDGGRLRMHGGRMRWPI